MNINQIANEIQQNFKNDEDDEGFSENQMLLNMRRNEGCEGIKFDVISGEEPPPENCVVFYMNPEMVSSGKRGRKPSNDVSFEKIAEAVNNSENPDEALQMLGKFVTPQNKMWLANRSTTMRKMGFELKRFKKGRKKLS